MTGSYLLPATVLLGSLVMGFAPALADRLGKFGQDTGERKKTGFRGWFLLTHLPSLILAGWAVDRWGVQNIWFGSCLVTALALMGLGAKETGPLRLTAMLLGMGLGGMIPAGITLMPAAFGGYEMPAHGVNLAFIVVSLGSLTVGLLADRLFAWWGIHRGSFFLAFWALIPGFLAIFIPGKDFPSSEGTSDPGILFWLAVVAGALYFPLEKSLARWATRYLRELGSTPMQAIRLTALFWLLFLASRLAAGFLPSRVNEAWLILILIGFSELPLGNMLGAYGESKRWGLLLVGACQGPILPTFLAIVLGLFTGLRGTAVGMIYAAGLVCSLLLHPIESSWEGKPSIRGVFIFPLLLGLVMAGPILVLALAR